MEWVRIGLEVLVTVGVTPMVVRWLKVGRRAKVAALVGQLAQEVLVAVARRHGVSAGAASEAPEAVELLRQRLVAAGVDPAKAAEIAKHALAGAAGPSSLGDEARDVLLGKAPKQP